MVYRFVIYLQPWEIDDFERQINMFIQSYYNITDKEDKIIFDVTTNLNIINWKLSSIPKTYFIDKIKYLESKLSDYYTCEFDFNENIKGCTDKRRDIHQYKKQDFIIWLDYDVYFNEISLQLMIEASKTILNKGVKDFILTPQTIKLWDNSWDIITADDFKQYPYTFRETFDINLINRYYNPPISVDKNMLVKFGGGWFNLFTNSIFEKIPIPEEIGSYGPDDTYISYCCLINEIPQFILKGIIVAELPVINKLYKNKNHIKDHLKINIREKEVINGDTFMKLVESYNDTYIKKLT